MSAPLPGLDRAGFRRASRHLVNADPVMAGLVGQLGPTSVDLHRGGSAFANLARAILAQQISVAAARSIAGRLRDRFGGPLRPEHTWASPKRSFGGWVCRDRRRRTCGISPTRHGTGAPTSCRSGTWGSERP